MNVLIAEWMANLRYHFRVLLVSPPVHSDIFQFRMAGDYPGSLVKAEANRKSSAPYLAFDCVRDFGYSSERAIFLDFFHGRSCNFRAHSSYDQKNVSFTWKFYRLMDPRTYLILSRFLMAIVICVSSLRFLRKNSSHPCFPLFFSSYLFGFFFLHPHREKPKL